MCIRDRVLTPLLHICIFVYFAYFIFHNSYFKLKFHISYFYMFIWKIFDVHIYIIYMFLYEIPKIDLENHDFLKTVKTQNFEKKYFLQQELRKMSNFFQMLIMSSKFNRMAWKFQGTWPKGQSNFQKAYNANFLHGFFANRKFNGDLLTSL